MKFPIIPAKAGTQNALSTYWIPAFFNALGPQPSRLDPLAGKTTKGSSPEMVLKKLPKKSWVKISQIRTLSVKRIRKKISKASEEELAIIIEGLNEIIGG
jgi:mRNA interferase MazF